jgi:hypothetical protein
MKKLFYRLSSRRSFAKLFSIHAQLEDRRTIFCRKSFLMFVLALAVVTLGRSQEAMGQEYDWGGPAPGSIDGGSTVLVYQCNRGGQGTNTLTLGDPDTFVSDGNVLCDFTGQVKGTGVQCHYHVEWTGDLASCVNTNAGAVVTVKSTCDNVTGVSGSLVCSATDTFQGATDLLGISSKSECERLFGRNANTLSTQVTYAGQTCDQVTAITGNGGLVLGGLTKTTTNLCHSDGGSFVDCITPGGATNKSNSDIPNLGETACVASPQNWNVDCSGNKDNGNGTVCYVNNQTDFFSFDPTKLDASTATLNGVPVDTKKGKASCLIKDCNGDGVLDFQCTFPTCSGGQATAAPPLAADFGLLTMVTYFKGATDSGGLICTTQVGTTP